MLRLGSSPAIRSVLTFAALSGFAGCTFLLDFDGPITTTDASSPDSGTADAMPDAMVDAQTVLNGAVGEPNNSISETTPLAEGPLEAAIWPNTDIDFYSFALAANVDLTITLAFDNSTSNLDLRLYNDTGTQVGSAAGTGALEEIILGPATGNVLPAGNYRVEVLSVTQDVSLDYTLSLARVPAS